jgi:cytoskeletal protein RodZ
MRLGTVLRKWRTMEEKSIRVASKEIGIGPSALTRIEQGKQCGAEILANVLYWLIRDGGKK